MHDLELTPIAHVWLHVGIPSRLAGLAGCTHVPCDSHNPASTCGTDKLTPGFKHCMVCAPLLPRTSVFELAATGVVMRYLDAPDGRVYRTAAVAEAILGDLVAYCDLGGSW